MRLNKGDFVRCTNSGIGSLTKGKEYLVTGIWHGRFDGFYVTGDDGFKMHCMYPECAFGQWELVTNDK